MSIDREAHQRLLDDERQQLATRRVELEASAERELTRRLGEASATNEKRAAELATEMAAFEVGIKYNRSSSKTKSCAVSC